MSFLRADPLTRAQWLLIAAAIVIASGLVVDLVYIYERYYRGITERELYGTWIPHPSYTEGGIYEFRPGGEVSLLSKDCRRGPDIKLKWYASGRNICLRSPEPWKSVDRNGRVVGYTQLVVWHILDISPNKVRVRGSLDDEVFVLERVDCPSSSASNQALQPTATAPLPRLSR